MQARSIFIIFHQSPFQLKYMISNIKMLKSREIEKREKESRLTAGLGMRTKNIKQRLLITQWIRGKEIKR